MNKLLKSKRRGSAVPLVVVAVVILLAMGVGLLSLGMNSRVYSIRTAQEIAARCAADAGMEMALFEMNEKLKVKPWDDSTLPKAINVSLPYSDEVCSYMVTGNLGSGYTIYSLGQSSESRRAVSGRIVLESGFSHAILTKEQLVLKSDTIVDGYNSGDPTDTEFEVDIGSQSNANDSVVLNAGVVVNGDAFVASGADLEDAIKGAGTVTGNKHTSPPVPLPTVTAPAGLLDKGDITVKGGTVTITPADSGIYTEIDLAGGNVKVDGKPSVLPGILEVSGGDVVLHVTGDIQLNTLCEIIVTKGATLTIYTDGNIHSRNNSSISTETPPDAAITLQIFATGEGDQFIDIKAKSEFTGTIYAPDDDVVLYAKGDAYGSVVADSFNYMAGGNFYFDEALREDVSIDDDAVSFVVTQWREGNPKWIYSLDVAALDAGELASLRP